MTLCDYNKCFPVSSGVVGHYSGANSAVDAVSSWTSSKHAWGKSQSKWQTVLAWAAGIMVVCVVSNLLRSLYEAYFRIKL